MSLPSRLTAQYTVPAMPSGSEVASSICFFSELTVSDEMVAMVVSRRGSLRCYGKQCEVVRCGQYSAHFNECVRCECQSSSSTCEAIIGSEGTLYYEHELQTSFHPSKRGMEWMRSLATPSLVADPQVPAGWNPCNSKQKTRLATVLHDHPPRTDRRSSGIIGEM